MECPQGSCDDIKTADKRINAVERCLGKKISWWQFVSGSFIVLGIIAGAITTITLYAMASEKGQNEKISKSNKGGCNV